MRRKKEAKRRKEQERVMAKASNEAVAVHLPQPSFRQEVSQEQQETGLESTMMSQIEMEGQKSEKQNRMRKQEEKRMQGSKQREETLETIQRREKELVRRQVGSSCLRVFVRFLSQTDPSEIPCLPTCESSHQSKEMRLSWMTTFLSTTQKS